MSAAGRPNRLGLIPARSGSKRLPGKNIRLLGGHPLVAWTIKAALASGCFDRIVVSTDSREIADVSVRYGVEVPFLRPSSLGADNVPTLDVVLHVLETLESAHRFTAGEFCILQPTSPYRTAGDIVRSHELFESRSANAVISVTRCAHTPLWMNVLGPGGSMDNFIARQHESKRSQELPPYYRLNGAIYWYKADVVREAKSLLPPKSFAYEMDEWRSVDIDELTDFEYAEFLLERGHVSMP